MDNEMPCSLTIVTSMGKAIQLHPLTHYPSSYRELLEPRTRNGFLEHFNISFHQPRHHQATFKKESQAPDQMWFSFFTDEEKQVLQDDYGFYGVMYRTDVKLARKRVEERLKKVEAAVIKSPVTLPTRQEEYLVRRTFHQRDEIKAIDDALGYFNLTDEITLTFVFSEWPDIEQMKKTDYVKEFEDKLLKRLTRSDSDELPF